MTRSNSCRDCESTSIDRRSFIRVVSGSAAAAAVAPAVLAPSLWTPAAAIAAPTPASAAETAVGRFFSSLSETQRSSICFPFDHELRSRISANWHVTKPTVGSEFYTKDQQALVDEIVRKITSEQGYERLKKQMFEDAGGIGEFSIAVFGTPGSGKFEWELTGRHLTLRADGDSVDNAAFGGPIIYGHGEEDPKKNIYYSETKKANEVFKSLDPKQADRALIKNAPSESAVAIQGTQGKFPGIAVADLSNDQKQLVESTLKTLLSPYRAEDVDEVMAILKATGGIEKLHMAFYQQEDLDNDKLWDIWRIEGPSLVWHFRGAPHVHAYINIGIKT